MRYNLEDIEIGDVVTVKSAFGHGPVLVGVVDDVTDDVKNGRPGIDYTVRDDNGNEDMHWAYLDQIIRVDHPIKNEN